MSETPDIGKIVSLIMSNPHLIEEISALAREDKSAAEEAQPTEAKDDPAAAPVSSTYTPTTVAPVKKSRAVLLDALRPYVSSERQQALDKIMTLADVFETVRRRG